LVPSSSPRGGASGGGAGAAIHGGPPIRKTFHTSGGTSREVSFLTLAVCNKKKKRARARIRRMCFSTRMQIETSEFSHKPKTPNRTSAGSSQQTCPRKLTSGALKWCVDCLSLLRLSYSKALRKKKPTGCRWRGPDGLIQTAQPSSRKYTRTGASIIIPALYHLCDARF